MKVIVALCFLSCTSGFCQLPTVVSAPIAEANLASANATLTTQANIMTGMSTSIAGLEKVENAYKDAMKQVTWMRNMQTAQRVLFMIENLVCTSKNLSVRMSAYGSSQCLYQFKFDLLITKMQMSADYIGIVLAGVSMTTAERMRTLNDVLKAFEESQQMMVELNKELDDKMKVENALASMTASFQSLTNHSRRKAGK